MFKKIILTIKFLLCRRAFSWHDKFKYLLLTLTLFFSNSVYATPAGDRLMQLLNNIRTVQADFTQTMINKHGKIIEQSRGHMLLQRPGKFRWDVRSPSQQLIVTNGSRLWIYDPGLEQVTIKSLSKTNDTPALLLSSHFAIEKNFFVQAQNDNGFVLVPRNKNSAFKMIRLEFANSQIQQMELHDHLEQTTMIQFSHVIAGSAINSTLFTFVPPRNVDIVDETRR